MCLHHNIPAICRLKRVPIITMGSLNWCENENPDMPIFMGVHIFMILLCANLCYWMLWCLKRIRMFAAMYICSLTIRTNCETNLQSPITEQEFHMVRSYTKDLAKSQNCQNWWVGATRDNVVWVTLCFSLASTYSWVYDHFRRAKNIRKKAKVHHKHKCIGEYCLKCHTHS